MGGNHHILSLLAPRVGGALLGNVTLCSRDNGWGRRARHVRHRNKLGVSDCKPSQEYVNHRSRECSDADTSTSNINTKTRQEMQITSCSIFPFPNPLCSKSQSKYFPKVQTPPSRRLGHSHNVRPKPYHYYCLVTF